MKRFKMSTRFGGGKGVTFEKQRAPFFSIYVLYGEAVGSVAWVTIPVRMLVEFVLLMGVAAGHPKCRWTPRSSGLRLA